MTAAPPPTSPERPDLSTAECRPDVLPRLRNIGRLHGENTYIAGTMADAINVISGLRESDARRLVMINALKARVAELEAAQQTERAG